MLRKENQNEQALIYFQKVIKINPMKAEAYCNIGCILLDLEKYVEALDSFFIAIEIESDNGMFYYNVACTYSLLEKVEDVIKYLSKAIELDKRYKVVAKKDIDLHNIKNNTEFKRITLEK